jgi:hypothetical protein
LDEPGPSRASQKASSDRAVQSDRLNREVQSYGHPEVIREFLDWYADIADQGTLRFATDVNKSKRLRRVVVHLGERVLGTGEAALQSDAVYASLEAAHEAIVAAEPGVWDRFEAARKARPRTRVQIAGGSTIDVDDAVHFLRWYTFKYNLEPPVREIVQPGLSQRVHATVRMHGNVVGTGVGHTKYAALGVALLEAVAAIVRSEPDVWVEFAAYNAARRNFSLRAQTQVVWKPSAELKAKVRDVLERASSTELAETAELLHTYHRGHAPATAPRYEPVFPPPSPRQVLEHATVRRPARSDRSRFLETQLRYLETHERHAPMREVRQSLPIYAQSEVVLQSIRSNLVTILVAETGSGKTTQVPQLILDDWVRAGRGSECNVIVTQPRRIAAVSVAKRIAAERGEEIGTSVGYIVKFEAMPPKQPGSILFTTVGTLLRIMSERMDTANPREDLMAKTTHLIIDEIHSREALTDLLLCMIKRMLAVRASAGLAPIRIVLMCACAAMSGTWLMTLHRSATIDPQAFAEYFKDPLTELPAPVTKVEGRTFPVDRMLLNSLLPQLRAAYPTSIAWTSERVKTYLRLELQHTLDSVYAGLPYDLVALVVDHAMKRSPDGHCLVFAAGLADIKQLRSILQDDAACAALGIEAYGDPARFEVCVMHSSVPLADQQLVFEPPAEGVRRVILSTDICETSVTIPSASPSSA